MTRIQIFGCMVLMFMSCSGCLCCPGTWLASDVVDDLSDHQACMDDCYDPTLDISRARMPDWNCRPLNRHFCRKGSTCECEQAQRVWYPAEYRTAYYNRLMAAEMKPHAPVPAPAPEAP